MVPVTRINLFNAYRGENAFTNGLLSVLHLATCEPYGRLRVHSFLSKLLAIDTDSLPMQEFYVRVLCETDFADAELRCGQSCLRFETKVRSGALGHVQIQRRLRELAKCRGRLKRVVLLLNLR